MTNRANFADIKKPKKQKRRDIPGDVKWDYDQGYPLASNLINNDFLGIFFACALAIAFSGKDSQN